MDKITILIYKYITGKLTDGDRRMLDRWIAENPDNAGFFKRVTDNDDLLRWYERHRMISYERPMKEMKRRIREMALARRRRYMKMAAAVIVLLSAVAAGIFLMRPSLEQEVPVTARSSRELTVDDIHHGKIKATLSSASGSAVCLSDTIAHPVEMLKDQIAMNSPRQTDHRAIQDLMLEVPRGGEFKIMLEDSTIVWLNAESSLRYPEKFDSGERRVEVTGEAYFEVKKDPSRPFYVESAGQEIRVYGTTFNIKSYPDEEAAYTTLQSGSVAIASGRDATAEMHLRPGNQAVLDRSDSSIEMKEVDPEVVASWRHGYFVFENQTLLDIMRDLSRWYDFKFEIADKELENDVFMGSFPRDTEFPNAIRILERSGGIVFTVVDGKVIVSKNNTNP